MANSKASKKRVFIGERNALSVIKKNTASRKKSRLALKVNKLAN